MSEILREPWQLSLLILCVVCYGYGAMHGFMVGMTFERRLKRWWDKRWPLPDPPEGGHTDSR